MGPNHPFYPGGEHEGVDVEDVNADGDSPLFSWGFAPLTGG